MTLAKPRYVENAVCTSISSEKDVDFNNIVKQMIEICRLNNGVGLAAPQVGIMKRFFIFHNMNFAWKLFINPAYTSDFSKYDTIEGCLTYGPNAHYMVQRYTKIRATWQEITFDGELRDKSEVFDNLLAQVFQHETDHCGNGNENGKTIAMIGKKVDEEEWKKLKGSII